MATGQTLIDEALRDLGIVGEGVTANATVSAEMLIKLNRMLDSWQTEGFLIFQIQRATHTLTASTNPHTIGSGGDINTTRPVSIEGAGLILSGETAERPLEILPTWREYQQVWDKSIESKPYALYYDAAFSSSLGNIFLAYVPDAADTLVLYTPQPLTSVATLGTTITFPPGYEECLLYNLELRAAPSHGIHVVPPEIARQARLSMHRVKKLNSRVPNMASADFGVSKTDQEYVDFHVGPFGGGYS